MSTVRGDPHSYLWLNARNKCIDVQIAVAVLVIDIAMSSQSPFSRDEALRLLLRRRSDLIAYLYTYAQDLHIAEDLFQEVALRAVDKHDQIKDAASAYAWLRSVARNAAIDWQRRAKRRPIPLDTDTLELLEKQWEQAHHSDNDELREALSHCVSQLTPRARQYVEQRFNNEMSTREIAEASGRKVDSIYTAFSRIYAALAKCIRHKVSDRGLGDA